jgi:hypothetical protein
MRCWALGVPQRCAMPVRAAPRGVKVSPWPQCHAGLYGGGNTGDGIDFD